MGDIGSGEGGAPPSLPLLPPLDPELDLFFSPPCGGCPAKRTAEFVRRRLSVGRVVVVVLTPLAVRVVVVPSGFLIWDAWLAKPRRHTPCMPVCHGWTMWGREVLRSHLARYFGLWCTVCTTRPAPPWPTTTSRENKTHPDGSLRFLFWLGDWVDRIWFCRCDNEAVAHDAVVFKRRQVVHGGGVGDGGVGVRMVVVVPYEDDGWRCSSAWVLYCD